MADDDGEGAAFAQPVARTRANKADIEPALNRMLELYAQIDKLQAENATLREFVRRLAEMPSTPTGEWGMLMKAASDYLASHPASRG